MKLNKLWYKFQLARLISKRNRVVMLIERHEENMRKAIIADNFTHSIFTTRYMTLETRLEDLNERIDLTRLLIDSA